MPSESGQKATAMADYMAKWRRTRAASDDALKFGDISGATGIPVEEVADLIKAAKNYLLVDYLILTDVVSLRYWDLQEEGVAVEDERVAKLCLASPRRPGAGIRFRNGEDDPFQILESGKKARRAGGALPRVAEEVEGLHSAGKISTGARDDIYDHGRRRADELTRHPGLATALPKMLPSFNGS